MLYCALFIVNWTSGAFLYKISLDTLDWFNTLMSLFEPAVPKYVCQIHKSYDATASSIMLGLAWLPRWNCPYHATGQIFIPSAYNWCFLTFLKNRAPPPFVIDVQCHYCLASLSIQPQKPHSHPWQTSLNIQL